MEAEGDYARLHSPTVSHLVRIPLCTFETAVARRRVPAGAPFVPGGDGAGDRDASSGSGVLVRLRANGASPAVELPVSRRQARELRDRLVRAPMRRHRAAADDSRRTPPRQRVVLAERRGARMVRTRVEVQEQTAVGEALMRGLMRAQLGLALICVAVVIVLLVGSIPLLNAIFPASRRRHRLGRAAPLAFPRRAGVPAALRRRTAQHPFRWPAVHGTSVERLHGSRAQVQERVEFLASRRSYVDGLASEERR